MSWDTHAWSGLAKRQASGASRSAARRPALFILVRDEDVSGVSGTGVIAEGVRYSDGSIALRWLGDWASTAVWADLETAMHVHGHEGRTRVIWADGVDPEADEIADEADVIDVSPEAIQRHQQAIARAEGYADAVNTRQNRESMYGDRSDLVEAYREGCSMGLADAYRGVRSS